MTMNPEGERIINATGANICQNETSFPLQAVCHVSTWQSVSKMIDLRFQYA
jgi:hypothetical protein